MESKKSRNNRFNSFDLSVSESKESNLKNIIFELQTFFPSISCELSETDKLLEELKDKYCDGNEEELNFSSLSPFKEKFVDVSRQDPRCLDILKSVRSFMSEGNCNVENVTNWDTLLKANFKYKSYITFCYTLMRLTEVSQDKTSREIAFNAGRTYFCLLALPGAKRCQIWEAELVIQFFKLFSSKPSMSTMSDYDDKFFEIQVIQMLDECRNVFNIVSISDQEEVLEKYVETLSSTLEAFLSSSRQSAHDIIMKCYENFELLCLKPLPDKEIEKIMYLVFCRTADLHFISQKIVSRYRANTSKHGESISDFFLYLLTNYFEKTKNVLIKFIKSILSTPNLDQKFDRDKCQKLFDIAVKYELAIYLKCNESIVEYMEKLAFASDTRQRLSCVDFCGRMLLINSTANPNQQPLRVEIPRETLIIKILFEKVYDKQDNVKLKALTAIKAGLINGNEYTKKIFGIIFKNKSMEDNPEIVQVLGEQAENFQMNLLSLLQTSTATYIRKASLEILSQHCDNLLDNEVFIETITSLTEDNSYLVKSNLIEVVNTLLLKHPTNKNVLDIWLEVILDLIRDNDNKIVEASVKALTSIFQKIESFENTVNEIQLLPWNIIRKIMAKNKRSLLQQAMSSVSTNFLSQEKLRKIETHIFTSHKSEAWCILSLIAKKMKSNNPDIVVKTFLDHIDKIDDHSFETNDFHLILEVIQSWTKELNVNSKTQIATKITELFEKGKCPISLVHHLYEICTLVQTILFGKEEMLKFSKRLNDGSKKYILDNSSNFAESVADEKLLCFLLLYCETNTDLPRRPEKALLLFLFDFLRKIVGDKIKISVENDTPRKLNCCVIVMTRFAVRDNELASDLTPLLAAVLKKKNMHMSCIKTTMQCLNDLCKKHTATVTPVFKEIIYKLHCPNDEIRLCALANVFDLVMQDFLKLRGRLLLNFLACLVDKNELIQLKSQAAILSYAADKNQNLLYTCFLDSVFLFNDFVQPDNFGVFPLDEIDRNHLLLHGDEKMEQRFELYKFFVQNIHEMNEFHLLMLLKQIIVFTEKLEKKKFKKNENGVRTFKDLLFIFKLICDKRGESKTTVSKSSDNTDYANDDDHEETAQTSTQPKTTRKKQNTMTMTDVIPIVEKMLLIYPKFVTEIVVYDKSLESPVNELTKSVVQNFSNFIEYSNNSFWSDAQTSVKACSSKKRKKTSKKTKNFCGDSSTDESE